MSCARAELAAQLVQRRQREQHRDQRLVVRQRAGELRARSSASSASAADQPPVATSAWPSDESSSTSDRVRSGPGPEPVGRVERAAQMADPLGVGVAANARSAARRRKRTARSGPGRRRSGSRARRPARRGRAVGVRQVRADARVQPRRALRREQLVEHLAVQVVHERVAAVARLDQRRAARQRGAADGDRVAVALQRRGEGVGREVAPGDARRGQHLGVLVGEPLELVADVGAQRRRHAGLQRLARARQRDRAGHLRQRPVGEPVVEQVADEQRVAARRAGRAPRPGRPAAARRGSGPGGTSRPRRRTAAGARSPRTARARRGRARARRRAVRRPARSPGTCRSAAAGRARGGAAAPRSGRASSRRPSAGPRARGRPARWRRARRAPRASRAASGPASRPGPRGGPPRPWARARAATGARPARSARAARARRRRCRPPGRAPVRPAPPAPAGRARSARGGPGTGRRRAAHPRRPRRGTRRRAYSSRPRTRRRSSRRRRDRPARR